MKHYWLVAAIVFSVAACFFAFNTSVVRYAVAYYFAFKNGTTIVFETACHEVSFPWFIISKQRKSYSLGRLATMRDIQAVTLGRLIGPMNGGSANDASVVFSAGDMLILDLGSSNTGADVPDSARYLLKDKAGAIVIVGHSENLTKSAFRNLTSRQCDS